MKVLTTYKEIFKTYMLLALPMMLGSMTVVLISWSDTIMISQLGNTFALAAAQLANQICGVFLLFLIGFSNILSPLVSSATARNNYGKATRILQHIMLINMLLGLLSSFLLIIFAPYCLKLLKQPAGVLALAQDYLAIIALSIIPSSINNAIKRYLEAIGWAFHTMCMGILAGLLNVCLNYILIYGKMGFPALGVNGAGWATLATRFFFMIIYMSYLLLLKKKQLITSFSKRHFEQKHFSKLFKLGLPSGLNMSVKVTYYASIVVMSGWCANQEIAQASTGVLIDIIRFIIMLPIAISSASAILVGTQWSTQNKLSILRIVKAGYMLAFGFMMVTSMGIYLIYPFILNELYQLTPQVESLINSLIRAIILFHLADGFNFLGFGILRGMRDTFMPFILSLVAYLGIGIPASYIMLRTFHDQELGIWLGLILGLVVAAYLLATRFRYKLKYLQLT